MTHKEERRRSTDKLASIICACEVETLKRALADSEEHSKKLESLLCRCGESLLSVKSALSVKSFDDLIEEIDSTFNLTHPEK